MTRLRRPLVWLLTWSSLAAVLSADTVVLKGGRRLTNVVVSRNDAEWVVINPWGSRHAAMTWEIPDKNRIPRASVEEVIVEDAPEVEYRRRASRPGLSANDHFELATFCEQHKLKNEREWQLAQALSLDPGHAAALEAFGGETKWKAHLRKNPDLGDDVIRAARAYVAMEDVADAAQRWDALEKTGTKLPLHYVERARRSATVEKGRRDKVPLTIRSHEAPGGTYAVYVPHQYDPLRPTALVIGLHGGGKGGKDETLVTGSGEDAMNFYQALAEQWGWIVSCPTALKAPWSDPANKPLLEAVIEEMKVQYNVDQRRIYLVGHSMGGFGTWHWGNQMGDTFAACSPCAGGGFSGIKIPVYIYHGTDDPICRVSNDRTAAKALSGGKVEFVYTELDGVGHGFPDSVRAEIFSWFAGRWKDSKRKSVEPDSSFLLKPARDEIKAFGDPGDLPSGDAAGESSVAKLVAALKLGGGSGVDAAASLGAMKTTEAVTAVAAVIRSKKSNVDARVLAADALGNIAIPECVKHLVAALKDDDFRVVDAVVVALGKIEDDEVPAALVKAGATLGKIWDDSFLGQNVSFTEYGVRLVSFGHLVDALAARVDPASALAVVDREIIGRVYAPRDMYTVLGEDDPRFKDHPSKARLELMRRIAACLVKYGDPAGAALLERAKERWSREPRLIGAIDEGLAALRSS